VLALRARKSSGVSGEIMPQSYTTGGLSVNRSGTLSCAVLVQQPLFSRSAATYNARMRVWRGLCFAMITASSVSASTLDVSALTSVVVHTGDTLVFHLLTSNFSGNAARLGLAQSPSQLDFALVSAPSDMPGEFAVSVESADQSVSEAFGELTFHSGFFQGSAYSGEVSILEGELSVPPLLATALLEGPFVVLALCNEGPDVRLGLDPYVLRQDLYAGVSGGPLSVGAVPYLVDLKGRANHPMLLGGVANGGAIAEVPEPGAGGLLLGGGVLLWAIQALRTRIFRRPAVRR
jgi:hypothetical protein